MFVWFSHALLPSVGIVRPSALADGKASLVSPSPNVRHRDMKDVARLGGYEVAFEILVVLLGVFFRGTQFQQDRQRCLRRSGSGVAPLKACGAVVAQRQAGSGIEAAAIDADGDIAVTFALAADVAFHWTAPYVRRPACLDLGKPAGGPDSPGTPGCRTPRKSSTAHPVASFFTGSVRNPWIGFIASLIGSQGRSPAVVGYAGQ